MNTRGFISSDLGYRPGDSQNAANDPAYWQWQFARMQNAAFIEYDPAVDDAIDQGSGFQWFYHSHSPEDRPGSAEHGHIHLFARRKLWSRRLRSARELAFTELAEGADPRVNTRHLLTIGFDAKGIPKTLFTVNSWVTGDLMLSASNTALLLDQMTLDTGNEDVDTVIECVVKLYKDEIRDLLLRRDSLLYQKRAPGILGDECLEVLSDIAINVDQKLAGK